MIRINLLPHRAARRRQRRNRFYLMAAAMVLLGLLVAFGAHSLHEAQLERQQARNAFLHAEIRKLDEEISEIGRLGEQIDALLARKQVIEALQGRRAEAVHLFNELAAGVPEGVYLKSARQSGARVLLSGYAQSNARVSNLMRSLENSPLLERPALVEVKAASLEGRPVSEFILAIDVVQAGEARAPRPDTGRSR